MYAGSAYAGAPYAGGGVATTPTPTPTEHVPGAFRMRVGSGVYVEVDAPVTARAAGLHRFDVVRAFPTPDLVNGRPT